MEMVQGSSFRARPAIPGVVLGIALVMVLLAGGTAAASELVDSIFTAPERLVPWSPPGQSSLVDTLPLWEFTLAVGFNQATITLAGGLDNAVAYAREQIDTINSRFNTPGVFEGEIRFVIDTAYAFDSTGNPYGCLCGRDFTLHYFDIWTFTDELRGSWGVYSPITHLVSLVWSEVDDGAAFGPWPTDILVHEFGHSRGAFDIYLQWVPADSNAVNGEEYPLDSTIMGSTQAATIWDGHSISVINLMADSVITSAVYLRRFFPTTIGLRVAGSEAEPLVGAEVRLYPVEVRRFRVETTPMLTEYTDAGGEVVFADNPFDTTCDMCPFGIRNANFLVEVSYGGQTVYDWLPLTEVQSAYFANPDTVYRKLIVVESATPVADEGEPGLPVGFALRQNHPNPFNPSTHVEYVLPTRSHVTVTVFDMLGRRVRTLVDAVMGSGTHTATWDGSDERGKAVASGVYLYRMEAGEHTESRRMVLVR